MQISLDFEQIMKWNVRILLYQLIFLILSRNHSFLVNVLYQIHVVYYIYKEQPCKQACLSSPVSIWSLTIVTIAGIVAIAENIGSLKFNFHIVAGIVQVAGHIRSLWSSQSLRSLCYDFDMIAGIVMPSLRSLQSLHWWFPLTFCDRWRSCTIATIAEYI